MLVGEVSYNEEYILNNVMKLGGHADCHNFVCSINKGTETSRSVMRRICWHHSSAHVDEKSDICSSQIMNASL